MINGLAVVLLFLPESGNTLDDYAPESPTIVGHREHQDALKACAASAFQTHRLSESVRIHTTLSVDLAGAVSAVTVSAPPEMSGVAECLEARLRHWTFPARDEAYSVSFPLILQGSGP